MIQDRSSGVARDPLVGQVLGRYRILAKLGQGAMAGVYLAEHSAVGATIVLKVLLPELASEPQFVESFLREARIASEIHHDNVIDIFYSGRAPEGQVFLAMEYIKGASLYDVLEKEGPLPWPRAKPLLSQIAGALAAAHAGGVVHRDVKPENVLVGTKEGPDGAGAEFCKVVDFGIANARGDIGGAEGVCGTPEFMPPEQAQGHEPDARDDVYAFGCLMYQVLTGDVPFRADDVPRVLLMHLRDPAPPPRLRRPDLEIPAGAQDIIMRALEKKRADRWQSMLELQRALDAVDLPPEPEPPPDPAGARLAQGAPAKARSRLVMPKEQSRLRSRLPFVVGAVLVVGGSVFAFARHAIQHAPGRIEIDTLPLDAEIYIDGQKMADRSPMFLDASPGPYSVLVRSPGFEPLARVLEMKARGQDRVLFSLEPLPQPKAPPPPRPRPAVSAIGGGVTVGPARRRNAAPALNGVTFIDFKKSASQQNAH